MINLKIPAEMSFLPGASPNSLHSQHELEPPPVGCHASCTVIGHIVLASLDTSVPVVGW